MANKIINIIPPDPINIILNASPIAITGPAGEDGVDGLSAYESSGFVGSEQEWLDSFTRVELQWSSTNW